MSEEANNFQVEIDRIRRVSDLMCTAHSVLSERYRTYSMLLSLAVLLLSAWLAAMALANPKYVSILTPKNLDSELWMGLLALFTFGLTIIELKIDWKSLAVAHHTSRDLYADAKREAVIFKAENRKPEQADFFRINSRYEQANAAGISVPDKHFLKLKRKHQLKVEVSKKLDKSPGSSIFLLRVGIIIRDNWPWNSNESQ